MGIFNFIHNKIQQIKNPPKTYTQSELFEYVREEFDWQNKMIQNWFVGFYMTQLENNRNKKELLAMLEVFNGVQDTAYGLVNYLRHETNKFRSRDSNISRRLNSRRAKLK